MAPTDQESRTAPLWYAANQHSLDPRTGEALRLGRAGYRNRRASSARRVVATWQYGALDPCTRRWLIKPSRQCRFGAARVDCSARFAPLAGRSKTRGRSLVLKVSVWRLLEDVSRDL